MASPVDICNIALAECGNRVQISSFNDGTPASVIANLFYTPKLQMLSRAAPWDSFRAQAALTLLKATIIDGAVSDDPPPQPWAYQYAWPSDCLRARFLLPTIQTVGTGVPLTTGPNYALQNASPPTAIPFVVATAFDASNNPIKVILTQLQNAQLVYTRDLTQVPDLWDSMFSSAATATLAAYFINALARNTGDYSLQIKIATDQIAAARAASASESISSPDHIPDWMQVRMQSAVPWAWNTSGPNGVSPGMWDAAEFPGGLSF